MYLDKDLKLYDFCDGQNDLKNKKLRLIGDPDTRIKEDPLRILRAIRFALLLDFEIESNTKTAILNNIHLLEKLNIEKIKQELRKIKDTSIDKKISLFNEFNILYLLDMVK
jgi:tRNA nucleotidyltransferase/poly(A) polymerase